MGSKNRVDFDIVYDAIEDVQQKEMRKYSIQGKNYGEGGNYFQGVMYGISVLALEMIKLCKVKKKGE